MSKGILAFSGGLDSTVLLSELIKNPDLTELNLVFFGYRQKNESFERKAVRNLLHFFSIEAKCELKMHTIQTAQVMDTALSKIVGDAKVPRGHFRSEQMKNSVVPGRNLLFAAIMAGIAESRGLDFVALGLHEGAVDIFPDCSYDWFNYAAEAIGIQTREKIKLIAPFITETKIGVVKKGIANKIPFEMTRSCYDGYIEACGKCSACQQRLTAFSEIGEKDPLIYLSRDLIALEN